MNEYIIIRRNLSTVGFRYFFVDAPPNQAKDIPNLVVPKESWDLMKFAPVPSLNQNGGYATVRPMDVHLFIKYFYCANYTLNHTRARWIARLADDTLVNFAKLGQLMDRLEARYDPLAEFVFRAHCIDYGGMITTYPQVGSGSGLSRFAREISIQHQIPMLKCIRNVEDVASVSENTSIHRIFRVLQWPVTVSWVMVQICDR
jgi:hypothetical protein